ncbi:MAG: hypothetical protein AB4042_18770, partial [Leptolyngbyaceae cyanobacterium]
MSTPTYHQLVADVRRLCTSLSLQLPTHETAIAAQVRKIRSIHQKLEITQSKVNVLAHQSWRLVQRNKYHKLDHLLNRLS